MALASQESKCPQGSKVLGLDWKLHTALPSAVCHLVYSTGHRRAGGFPSPGSPVSSSRPKFKSPLLKTQETWDTANDAMESFCFVPPKLK